MNWSSDLRGTAIAAIDGRFLRFQSLPYQARLRVLFCGKPFSASVAAPELEADGPTPGMALGSVIGLDGPGPALRVSAPLHTEWARANQEAIVAAAVRIWAATAPDRAAAPGQVAAGDTGPVYRYGEG